MPDKITISTPEYGKKKRKWFYTNNYWQLRQAKYLTQPAPEAKQDNSDLIARAYLDL